MSVKTERITILTTPDFKQFLSSEAVKEGVSVSELVRERCSVKPIESEEIAMLKAFVEQVNESTDRAEKSLTKGLREARETLKSIRQEKAA